MHAKTHEAIACAVYKVLPISAKDFLRLSEIELRYYARISDDVDGDNIFVSGGCALEEAHAHSWKMAWDREHDTFEHLTGSVPTVIAQTPREVRNAVHEGDWEAAREGLGKLIGHYTVDSQTIWHLTRELTSEQHRLGEGDIVKVVKKALAPPVEPLWRARPKSLYNATIEESENTLRLQLDRLKAAQAGDDHIHDKDLMVEMVRRCAAFSLSAFLYAWHYLERA